MRSVVLLGLIAVALTGCYSSTTVEKPVVVQPQPAPGAPPPPPPCPPGQATC